MKYEPKIFNLPELKDLSPRQIEVHLGLYGGYVTNTNLLREQIYDLESIDKEKYAYALSELRRRLGFEFNGMRMHEYYFEQFEGGLMSPDTASRLHTSVSAKYGSWGNFIEHIKTVAKTRGIGWTVVYYDPRGNVPHVAWVGDHEFGHLAGLPVILALDMWEHAYMVDYIPAEKAKYINAFLAHVNWSVPETRFKTAS